MAIHHPARVTKLAVTGDAYARLSPDGAEHWPILRRRLKPIWMAEPSFAHEQLPGIASPLITRSFMVAFPDMQVLMDDLVVQGDNTDYRCTLLGTNTGPGGTRCRVRISGFEDWTTGDDGFIAASLGHYDRAEYDRQLEHGEGVDGARIARRLRSPSAPSRFIAAPFLFRSVVARRSRSLLPARRGTGAAALHRARAASRGSPRRDAEPL
jgi:hypothetical protein